MCILILISIADRGKGYIPDKIIKADLNFSTRFKKTPTKHLSLASSGYSEEL